MLLLFFTACLTKRFPLRCRTGDSALLSASRSLTVFDDLPVELDCEDSRDAEKNERCSVDKNGFKADAGFSWMLEGSAALVFTKDDCEEDLRVSLL